MNVLVICSSSLYIRFASAMASSQKTSWEQYACRPLLLALV